MSEFIDFTEIKGETWYSADDILLCLGYAPNALGGVDLLRNNRTNQQAGKVFNIQPRKFIDKKVWWNETSLLRYKQYLKSVPRLKNKLDQWDNMEFIRKDSVKSVLCLDKKVKTISEEVKTKQVETKITEPKEVTNKQTKPLIQSNDQIDFVKIYKEKRNFKDFIKEARKQGAVLKGRVNSWSAFQANHPDIYSDVEKHFSLKTKNLMGGKEEYKVEFKAVKEKPTLVADEYIYKIKTVSKKGLFGLQKEVETQVFTDVGSMIDFIIDNAKIIESVERGLNHEQKVS